MPKNKTGVKSVLCSGNKTTKKEVEPVNQYTSLQIKPPLCYPPVSREPYSIPLTPFPPPFTSTSKILEEKSSPAALSTSESFTEIFRNKRTSDPLANTENKELGPLLSESMGKEACCSEHHLPVVIVEEPQDSTIPVPSSTLKILEEEKNNQKVSLDPVTENKLTLRLLEEPTLEFGHPVLPEDNSPTDLPPSYSHGSYPILVDEISFPNRVSTDSLIGHTFQKDPGKPTEQILESASVITHQPDFSHITTHQVPTYHPGTEPCKIPDKSQKDPEARYPLKFMKQRIKSISQKKNPPLSTPLIISFPNQNYH